MQTDCSHANRQANEQEADLPSELEELRRVITDSQAQPLRVVILQDAQRLQCQADGRSISEAVPFKVYKPCDLANICMGHTAVLLLKDAC